MASSRDNNYIWIVNPVYDDDFGNKSIVGYNNIQKINSMYVPATSDADYALYGSNVTNIMKFSISDKFSGYSVDGGDGVYLKEPTLDQNGYYQNPEYVTKPVRNHLRIWLFDGVKQFY